MKKYIGKFYLPAMLGASIEYYDIALYGYLAPVLVPVFLPYLDKTTAYFFYFLFEFFAALFQILGAKYYGRMGDQYGRRKAMYWSMLGTSCVTFTIAFIPTYQHLGIMATVLFCSARVMQSFFLGGEYNGGAIYCLENEIDHRKHGQISGLYCAFTVSGIILASIVATIVHALGDEYFRAAYFVSFLFAICVYQLRKNIKETLKIKHKEKNNPSTFSSYPIRKFLALVVASLFFGVLYGLPTRIFNVILPMITDIGTTQLMFVNTVFLILYMLLLVIFGMASDRCGFKKVMGHATVATALLAYPLFLLIETKLFFAIFAVKACFVLLTAAFIGPFHVWTQSLCQASRRYSYISIGYAVGKCCSTILLASVFLVFQKFDNLSIIGLILGFIALITIGVFHEKSGFHAEVMPRH